MHPTREILDLHAFFERWFRGDEPAAALDRVARVLAPGFALHTFDGPAVERDELLRRLGAHRGTRAGGRSAFRIRVDKAFASAFAPDRWLASYQEWQRRDGVWSGRQSAAVLAADAGAPCGFVWLHLLETPLDVERGE